MLKFTADHPEVQRLIDACYNRELNMTTADTRQFIATRLNRIAQDAVEASREYCEKPFEQQHGSY